MNIITTHAKPASREPSLGLVSRPVLNKIRDGDPDRDERPTVLLIDSRALERECLTLTLASKVTTMNVVGISKFDDWQRDDDLLAAVLVNIGGMRAADSFPTQLISRIVRDIGPVPLVVLADSEDVNQILHVLELGAKGYIPTTVGVGVCAEAIMLARAGGVFVPGSTLIAMRRAMDQHGSSSKPMLGLFTARQGEVLQALRRGKANKIIAHELDLKESTVKVHVRNIMRKLKASNRTEVVSKVNELLAQNAG